MFAIIKRYKKTSIVVFIALSVWVYQEFRPTIIFHTPQESKYLGKVVCTYSGVQDKLYIKDNVAKYRIPYTWNWKEDDEIAIFTRNYGDLLKKKDIDFWRLDVYLDEEGNYIRHTERKYFRLHAE
ncbi:hypothetical protein AALN73_22465 [Bacteroides stercorirosoris]|uniref:hypothetical protein n=1 Tax=Bacteroides stercorirosoris TaxID=871324 RepID=UPI0035198C86